jgi:hypothetical protein
MWSLKSKGSIGSVVATVGIVGVVAGSVGLCAFKSGSGIEIVGPVLAASGPLTAAYSGVYPEDALDSTLNAQGLATARIGLFIGALIFGGIWIAVVYGLRASLVHNFDMTVRRLAGTA